MIDNGGGGGGRREKKYIKEGGERKWRKESRWMERIRWGDAENRESKMPKCCLIVGLVFFFFVLWPNWIFYHTCEG